MVSKKKPCKDPNNTEEGKLWKDIPNYEGHYQASNTGDIRGVDRVVKSKRHKNGLFIKGRVIVKNLSIHGYYQLTLKKDGKQKGFRVHQLIAMTFLNHKPCGLKIVVDHIDNNKLNNNVNNLRLITNRENSMQEHIDSSSKYTGVYKQGGRWCASILSDGDRIHLGVFDKELLAHKAYQEALFLHNSNKRELIYEIKQKNREKKYSSKYMGVAFDKESGKWVARITINKKCIYLGRYNDELAASKAYLKYKKDNA